jgi:GntR family transcriptional regulator/MocR family aminotransferase
MSGKPDQIMWELLFQLSPERDLTLQAQLREGLVAAILDGHIPPDSPLPSSRELSKKLRIARNTVVLAYQHLISEGYLISRERSGYFVNPNILEGRVSASPQRITSPTRGPDWQTRLKQHPAAQRNIEKPTDWQRYPYPFVYGQLDPSLIPIADWRECWRQSLSSAEIRSWAPDRVDADDPLLIEQIQTRLLSRRGVWTSPKNILVTMGAQNALYLLAALLLGPDERIGIEDPGYVDARNIFSNRTRRVSRLSVDDGGLVIDQRLHSCRYVYTTPSHQSPTTVTMPLERRRALLDAANEHDLVIIEDDYESETNFVGEPAPALKSLDECDRVIYLGSLSKTLAPGLRLGYLVGPVELIREARALRRLILRHPPVNNQRTVALFLSLGHHDSLLRTLTQAYHERWLAMGEALARQLPDSTRVPTFGGTSYWVKGPAKLDARELRWHAARKGILIEAGDIHFMSDDPPLHFFRLGYSSIPVERIEPGIRGLAHLIRELVRFA